ncbi:MAG: succinate dehydrogenase/fumarate reductase iron-sulfur subunit [Planctomycetota bacterium]|jgi:succinate dehydrogenase / fumarate reductase iron-sulfur subunit
MDLTLHIWRQKDTQSRGRIVAYPITDVSEHMSFLEMLDVLNEQLLEKGEEPVAFDHDCREGICGMCSLVINGVPHGPDHGATVCQLHMRKFKQGDEIWIEPWRAKAFPVLKDLIVDRTAFDKIIQAGGYISVCTGSAPDANAIPIEKRDADLSFEAAACIGCGACVAACKNASAMLFVSAKVVQFAKLPQGQPERRERALQMVEEMDRQGFGNCTNYLECEAVCPKMIPGDFIAQLNREYLGAAVRSESYV